MVIIKRCLLSLLLHCHYLATAFVVTPNGARSSSSLPHTFFDDGNLRCNERPSSCRPSFSTTALGASSEDEFLDDIYKSADAVFGMIDGDANGSISYSELQSHLIDVCGYTQDAVDAMYYALDANMDGEISRDELRMGFVRYENLREAPGMGGQNSSDIINNEESIRAEAKTMFNEIDEDGSGMIDNDELRSFLRSRGYGDSAIDNIYSTLDVNSDGEISREELTDAFVRYSALRRATGAETTPANDFQLFEDTQN